MSGTYTAPWIISVRQTLDECGLSYIWLDQRCENIKGLKLLVEQRLKDQFLQKWHSELQGMTSCDFYREIKQVFKVEKYLSIENVKIRQAICNLRLSNNRIPKVTGRYKSIERNKRYCNLCSGDLLGDEYHVILECKNETIVTRRNSLLPKYYVHRPSMFKCLSILQTDNQKLLYKLGCYLNAVLPLFR